jgi:predicted RNA-binding Zn-ribbon protein involved in translation (DUF1610 family)
MNEWITEKKILKSNDKFKSCPYCGGEIVQKCYGGIMPMWTDPVCKSCGRRFEPKKKWFFLKGFVVTTD